eukprot:GFUD01038606.1.p1 GENE.GFUD01038606.1~~GFUD01038606.1.p1  ORF type:complete len:242 (+),score=99.40 GFUD01038606.1:275-1000(+)
MFLKSPLGKSYCCPPHISTPAEALQFICQAENLPGLPTSWRIEQNGKFLTNNQEPFSSDGTVTVLPSGGLPGGKGGFGSLLRAIGAQIEKTTNHEAMRDLSGRRQRDVNNEKRVRDYVAKQGEREKEEKEKKEVKMEKLRRFVEGENKDKHSFSDPLYDKARSEVEEKVHDAVEAAMKAATEKKEDNKTDLKRKGEGSKSEEPIKKKKTGLDWMGEGLDDLSDSDLSDSADEEEGSAVVPV